METEYQRRYRQSHRNERLQYLFKYRQEHSDELKRYRREHKSRLAEYAQNYALRRRIFSTFRSKRRLKMLERKAKENQRVLCACGCGKTRALYSGNNLSRPLRYIRGHHLSGDKNNNWIGDEIYNRKCSMCGSSKTSIDKRNGRPRWHHGNDGLWLCMSCYMRYYYTTHRNERLEYARIYVQGKVR